MKMLFDSDFLFGLFVAHDPHHNDATKQFREFQKKRVQLFVLTLVIQETATVISHKVDHAASLDFLRRMRVITDVNHILIDEALEDAAWKVFEAQTKKGTSFVDCANLAATKKFGIDGILSFDKLYPKKLLIK